MILSKRRGGNQLSRLPKVSVLLPTHNRAEVVGYAIKSVLCQTHQDFEILIVGDGCTDNTANIVASFNDDRIRFFDLPKAKDFGYANRNVALKQAKGSLVAYLGHDNLLLPDHLERLAATFFRPEVQFAYSCPMWVRDDGLCIPFFVNLLLPPHLSKFLWERNVIPSNCVMHRRGNFDEVGYWSEEILEAGDYDLWKRIINKYGPRCIQPVRQPTCLHFRANWRNPLRWGPAPLGLISLIHDSGNYWPGGLVLNVPANSQLPQAHVWNQIETDTLTFVNNIRIGTQLAQDILAWSSGLHPNIL